MRVLYFLFYLQLAWGTTQEQLDDLLFPKQEVISADNLNNWRFNIHISKEERKWITPYLIPENHPIRKKLDKIFHASRATSDAESMEKAGFTVFHSGSKTRVASHPSLLDDYGQRYLIKFHYDCDLTEINTLCLQPLPIHVHVCRHCPSWKQLINRAMGAKKIEKALAILDFQRFIVAKKWLYPLPIHPYKKKEGYKRKNYILVVERLSLFPHQANKNLWKLRITKEMLNELYTLMSIGIGDVSHENAPFTRSGKWAFIDTECCLWVNPGFAIHPHPGESLNKEMAQYWKELCESNQFHYQNLPEKQAS